MTKNGSPGTERSLSSFNARTYSAQRVARSFVPSPAFETLINPSHTMLSGPRGSGKTTLLKMLQPEALENWHHIDAAGAIRSIDYTGVFIATDRIWKEQFEASDGAAIPELHTALADSAFATHMCREIVSTMAWRAHNAPSRYPHHLRATLSPADEQLLVRELSDLLRVRVDVPRLEAVVSALITRFREHGELQRRRGADVSSAPDWLISDAIGTAEACVRHFNNFAGQHDHQWALLFDEMELAPPRVTEAVLEAMRGTQSVLLFKLSLSPVQPELATLNLPNAGVHGQDFELIMLSLQQRDATSFARSLVESELRTRYGEEDGQLDLDELFGEGRFTSRPDDGAYDVGSFLWKRYEALAERDPSFAAWLRARDVDLNKLGELSASERAAKLRKIRNVVVIREFYNRPNSTGRKNHDLYTGADGLLTLVDGNPRLLMALLGQILPSKPPMDGHISRATQSAAIDSLMDRFTALLSAQPSIVMPNGRHLIVRDLVHAIGEALGRGVVNDPFHGNVVTTFTVDSRLPAHIIKALQIALNVGAVVHIPDDIGRPVPITLAGERFRLSYVLAPRYRLPLRLGESRSLRSILLRSDGRRWIFSAPQRRTRAQPSLFELTDNE